MAKFEGIKVKVDVENLDEAMEKANQLKATLEECAKLIDSLSGSGANEVYRPYSGKL